MSASMLGRLSTAIEVDEARGGSPARRLVPIGRALYAAIFIFGSLGHFARPTIELAAQQGVPLPDVVVPASGVMSLIGGLSVLAGYRARLGAALLILFLLPVTFTMHVFWAVSDPLMAAVQRAMFFKNVALMGAALLLIHFGAGPYSLGSLIRKERAPFHRPSERSVAA